MPQMQLTLGVTCIWGVADYMYVLSQRHSAARIIAEKTLLGILIFQAHKTGKYLL